MIDKGGFLIICQLFKVGMRRCRNFMPIHYRYVLILSLELYRLILLSLAIVFYS